MSLLFLFRCAKTALRSVQIAMVEKSSGFLPSKQSNPEVVSRDDGSSTVGVPVHVEFIPGVPVPDLDDDLLR